MCIAQRPQRSDAGEARTRGPSVSSQTLYHFLSFLYYWHDQILIITPGSAILEF